MAKRSSISAAWPSNASPWPGRTRLTGSSRVSAQRAHVHHQRVRAPVARLAGAPAERREISGFEEMLRIRWSPPISSPDAASKKTVSDGRVPRPVEDLEACASANASSPPSRSERRDRRAAAPAVVGARDRAQRGHDVGADAVAQHQRLRPARRWPRRRR